MKTIKVLALTFALSLAGTVYAANGGARQTNAQNKTESCCAAGASCCSKKEGQDGMSCCADQHCSSDGASCCSAGASCCKGGKSCASGKGNKVHKH